MMNKKGKVSQINSIFSANPFIKKNKNNTLIATPSKFAIRKRPTDEEEKAVKAEKANKAAGIREKLKK